MFNFKTSILFLYHEQTNEPHAEDNAQALYVEAFRLFLSTRHLDVTPRGS